MSRSEVNVEQLDDAQKRSLRALRRGYRVEQVEVKDNGWQLEIRYMDGSTVSVIVGVLSSNFIVPDSLAVIASNIPIDHPELVLPLIFPADRILVAVGFVSYPLSSLA